MLANESGTLMYPFLEATGATLNNANKGVAAYLPKKSSTPWGATTMQLRFSDDDAGAFDDCDINIVSTGEGAAAHSGERLPADETTRSQYDAEANETYKIFKAGVEPYKHNWHHHPKPFSVNDLEQILATNQEAHYHIDVYSERVLVTTLLKPGGARYHCERANAARAQDVAALESRGWVRWNTLTTIDEW